MFHLVSSISFPLVHPQILFRHPLISLLLFLPHKFPFILNLHLLLILHLRHLIHKTLIPALHLFLLLLLPNLRIHNVLENLIVQLHFLHCIASLQGFVRLGRN